MRNPQRWRGLVVLCANTAWEENPLAAKNLALRLRDLVPVLYVDPPVSHLTARRRPELRASLAGPRLRIAAPGVARLTPVVLPGKDRPGMSAVTDRLVARAIRRAVDVLGGDARAVVDIAPNHHVYAALPHAQHVFWVQDDYTADPALTGIAPALLEAGEARHAREADLVVAVSPVLAEKWRRLHPRVELVPNGCDDDLFSAARDATRPPALRDVGEYAVAVSRFSPRIDLALLEAVAQRGLDLVLVGAREPGADDDRWAQLVARPNVHWVGVQPYEHVARHLAGARVGLLPYADSEFNRASFPLKTLEYLAAGLPVVATDLPFLDWLDCEFVARAHGPAEFADAAAAALTLPYDPATAERRRRFAAGHSWAARARAWARLLERPVSDGG